MTITAQQLLQILPNAGPVAGVFVPVLNTAMGKYGVVTRLRVAAFIAQVGHESGHLRRVRESLDYKVEALISGFSRERISEADARAFGRTPTRAANQQAIANCLYGGTWGAKSLGNTTPGDGWTYRGRGLIQVTGRANYKRCGDGLGVDLISQPELLEQPRYAALSAAWFFYVNGLNSLADAGAFQDIGSVINTGKPGRTPKGAEDRKALYETALKVLA